MFVSHQTEKCIAPQVITSLKLYMKLSWADLTILKRERSMLVLYYFFALF